MPNGGASGIAAAVGQGSEIASTGTITVTEADTPLAVGANRFGIHTAGSSPVRSRPQANARVGILRIRYDSVRFFAGTDRMTEVSFTSNAGWSGRTIGMNFVKAAPR